MALFKIEKGLSTDLATKRPNTNEGWCYFTTDDGKFYIDTNTATGDVSSRIALNAYKADYLKSPGDGSLSGLRWDGSVTTADYLGAWDSSGTYPVLRAISTSDMRTTLNVPTRTGGNASGDWGINITGNAATATALTTATAGDADTPVYFKDGKPVACTSLNLNAASANKVNNALSINGKTFDGSSAIDAGVIGASYGGTGKTSLIDSCNALINALKVGTSPPKDADYYIAQYAGGGTTETTYYRRPVSKLWEYIKGKADSEYVNIGGDTMTGNLTVPTLTISSTEAASHIQLSRSGANYIKAPADGTINFNCASSNLIAESSLIINSTQVYPGSNATFTLGTSARGWKGAYFSGGDVNVANGDLVVARETTIANNKPAAIVFKNIQSDNSITTSNAFIRVYDDHDAAANGGTMVI